MAGTAGKKARLKVAVTSGGTYNVVQGVQNISFSIDGENVDVSELGVDYHERVQGLKDIKVEVSGNLKPGDTNGQAVIKSGFLNDTPLFFQVLPDGGTTANAGWQFEGKVSSLKGDTSQTDKVGWGISIEGSGAATSV